MVNKEATKVTPEQARKTALVVASVLGVVAAVLWYRSRPLAASIVLSVAVLLSVVGILIPPLAIVFHRVWMTIALALGYVNSRIILTVIYFLIFVPYRVVSRLFGRDPLQLRGQDIDSYWTRRTVTRQSKEQFERLF